MKRSRVKKETDKKTAVMQLVIMALIGAAIGGTGSIIFNFWGDDVVHMMSRISKSLIGAASGVLLFLSLFLIAAAPLCVRNIKKKLTDWNQEEEEEAEKLQQYMERVQMFLAIFMNVTMCICGIALADHAGKSLFATGLFALAVFSNIFWLNKIVEYRKVLNPEKKGNILSWSFEKEWLESCDEQEKLRIYRAGYYTYYWDNIISGAVFIALICTAPFFDMAGILFFVLGAIWCAKMFVYWYYYEKKR